MQWAQFAIPSTTTYRHCIAKYRTESCKLHKLLASAQKQSEHSSIFSRQLPPASYHQLPPYEQLPFRSQLQDLHQAHQSHQDPNMAIELKDARDRLKCSS